LLNFLKNYFHKKRVRQF